MENQRFYKRERLCAKRDIDRLFPSSMAATGGRGVKSCAASDDARPEIPGSVMAYPWRAVWLPGRPDPSGAERLYPRLLIVVPKRRLRHAVDRVTMRRRLREAYRRNRSELTDDLTAGIDLGLLYVADKPTDVAAATASLRRIFRKIKAAMGASRSSSGPLDPQNHSADEFPAPDVAESGD